MTILKVAGKETKNSLMRMFTTESLNCYSSLKKLLFAFEFSNSWHDHSRLPV